MTLTCDVCSEVVSAVENKRTANKVEDCLLMKKEGLNVRDVVFICKRKSLARFLREVEGWIMAVNYDWGCSASDD